MVSFVDATSAGHAREPLTSDARGERPSSIPPVRDRR